MSDTQRLDAALAALTSASLLEPTKKLTRMLGGCGASLSETHLSSIGKPRGLSSHCSRETSGAQVTNKGDSRYATPTVPS
jgi:hypothetical protein